MHEYNSNPLIAGQKAPTGPREARPDDRLHAVFAPEDPAIQADVRAGLRRRLDARVEPAHEGENSDSRVEASQRSFADALLDPDRSVPAALTSHTARVPEKRFAVYRNNVVAGLVNALAARFPATQRIVGEEFFRAMAQIYARANPPRSRLLMQYGDGFADFIAAFEPAAELVYLADVARLEAARTRAYHAADKAPIDPKLLQSVDESALGDLRIERHPAAEIVRSSYPVVTIWAMNSGEREPDAIEDWRGEDALVVRPQLEVFVRALPGGGAAFLSMLFDGAPLAKAVEAAMTEREDFDLVANLAGLISSGAVCDVAR